MPSLSARPKPELTDRILAASPWWSAAVGMVGYAGWHLLKESLGLNRFAGLGEVYPPVWLAFWIMMASFAFVHQKRRAGVLDEQTGLDSLRTMDWKRFESLVAEAYQRLGYRVEYQLDAGPDGGVDVRLRKDGKLTLVQCKHRQNGTVGVSVAREMFGLLHHEKADAVIITTTGHFTPEAEAFAEGKPITLLNGSQLWTLVREVQQAPSPAVTEALPEIPAEALAESPPRCPRCGGGMQRKERRHDRVPFWGCLRWPECEGSVSI